MENIKEKVILIIVIIIALVICVSAYYMFFYNEFIYYTQVDNTKIKEISQKDNMKYEYTLNCYNENGKEKEIKFKTSRELRQEAYLKLKVMIIRGVTEWEEVQYDELPE